MEKEFIKSVIYYLLALQIESLDEGLKIFSEHEGKEWCDELISSMPKYHPARICYDNISLNGKEFDKMKSVALVKIAMYQMIREHDSLKIINSEADVDSLVEYISNGYNENNVANQIRVYKNSLGKNKDKLELYLKIFEKYCNDMEYVNECCHTKINLNEQLKNVSAGFCENAILCYNSMFLEKNTGSELLRKKNVPKIGETENVLSYHRIEFAGNEEFNLLYLPNEIYDLKEEDFNNIALIKCRFNKKIKEDIQNEILEVIVLKVTMLSDFIELYPLNYTGKAIESFEENNEYLTIDKFDKWKCYISNIEGDLENWQITYTDNQNVEHCLIRGFWCMGDEDIASIGNVIYSEEENKKFWKDVLASDGIKINGEELYTDKSILDSNSLNNEDVSRVIMTNMINLKKILQEYNYDMDSIINFSIGCDDKIYILLKDGWKSQYCDMINGSNYSMIVLGVDWQNYIIKNTSHYKLGTHKKYFYHIQPIMDKILLVGSDDLKAEDGVDTLEDIIPGGAVVDYFGNVMKEFSFGECINDCIVLDNGNIITSYGDEGIFGNVFAGGSSGLTVWNMEGNSIWDTNRDVSDCYAINIDSSNDLWYYYYTDFDLIYTDLKDEKVYDPKIEYANGFLLNDSKNYIIFAKKNREQHIYHFIIESFINENIEKSKELYFEYNNENIKIKELKFRKSKAVFIDEEDRIFLKWFR